ncbi:HepT-like ribonuclease domain-containing protein [Marinomonas sp. 2405UD68-3]|uniref:HepT-like ribonuclease domain-containing protein n=1 Tax=Marinomonas sp. 2405UD68-3 TaxID=3391835 RepID=UPI0039C8D42D
MRNKEWELSLIEHQHSMIQRLDKFRKQKKKNTINQDEKMVIEHSFQLLVASMLDLAKYVLLNHYQTEATSRKDVLDLLLEHRDITFEQGEQMKALIHLREQILFDYLDENFSFLESAMDLRRYSLVEVLAKEWITQLSNVGER